MRLFGRDRRGATAVEFAMVCLPFIGFVLLVFQVALIHFGRQTLDYATADAARAVLTGTLSGSEQTSTVFRKNRICPKLLMNFDCNKVVVNAYKVTPQNSDAAKNTGIYQFIDATALTLRRAPAQTSFCLGGPGDYVFLDVSYDFPSFLGSVLTTVGVPPSVFNLRATTFFRSEQFVGAGGSC